MIVMIIIMIWNHNNYDRSRDEKDGHYSKNDNDTTGITNTTTTGGNDDNNDNDRYNVNHLLSY